MKCPAWLALPVLLTLSFPAQSDDSRVREAIEKSLPLLQATGPTFWAGSGCFSCHNNTLPDIAVSLARERGFKVDEDTAALSRKQTLDWLDLRKDRLLEGLPPAGGQNTMGNALFSLALTDTAPTETLYAGARFLKTLQNTDGSWQVQNHRPPLVSSSFALTAMSLRGLEAYAPPAQRKAYAQSVREAVKWLSQAEPRATEDIAFRILGLSWGGGPRKIIDTDAKALIRQQREDGGWSQLPFLESDSYATGQALFALHFAKVPVTEPVFQRGVAFLVRTQLADGSWHVKSRSEPSQAYFESGYPHGVDQFISAAGASWATAALLLTQPSQDRGLPEPRGQATTSRGPSVWLDMDQAQLDAAYDNQAHARSPPQVGKRSALYSDEVRARLGEPLRFAYGPTPIEGVDVYKTDRPNAPVQVYIHGGGWRSGSARKDGFAAETFVNAGAVFVAVDYIGVGETGGDLAPLAKQVRSAVAWVRRNAHRFGADPDRIFVTGHSAGGHLAAVVLTTNWKDFGLPQDTVKGGIVASGMYDLKPVRLSSRSRYVRITDETEQALSPQRHLDKLAAPVVVIYGSEETREFQRQGRDFAAAVRAAGKPVELIVGESFNHFELNETLGNPYGVLGRAALKQMGLSY